MLCPCKSHPVVEWLTCSPLNAGVAGSPLGQVEIYRAWRVCIYTGSQASLSWRLAIKSVGNYTFLILFHTKVLNGYRRRAKCKETIPKSQEGATADEEAADPRGGEEAN